MGEACCVHGPEGPPGRPRAAPLEEPGGPAGARGPPRGAGGGGGTLGPGAAARARRAALARERRAEAALLAGIRAARAGWGAGEAGLAREKARLGERQERRDARGGDPARTAVARAAAEEEAFGGAAEARAWREHGSRWEAFERGTDTVGPTDVPWPPPAEGRTLLAALAALDRPGGAAAPAGEDREDREAAEFKRAYRLASLRWHPDKFQNRHGPRLAPGTAEETLVRVSEVAQRINSAWADFAGS